jgi:serine/threonine protein kinase
MQDFILEESMFLGQDGFRGTVIEFGKWKGRKVAIKFGEMGKHKHEAFILLKLGKHPSIVELLKDYEEGERFIVLESVGDGRTLKDVFEEQTKFSLQDCIDLLLQLAKGIQHIHDRNIIHHDMKDNNVLIDGNILKICDFELSVESENGIKGCGTSQWMAPEVSYDYDRSPISNKIDIYGFGKIFIKMIFSGRDTDIVKYTLPLELFDLMYQCTERFPENRPNIHKIIGLLQNYNKETYLDRLLNDINDKDEYKYKKILKLKSDFSFD